MRYNRKPRLHTVSSTLSQLFLVVTDGLREQTHLWTHPRSIWFFRKSVLPCIRLNFKTLVEHTLQFAEHNTWSLICMTNVSFVEEIDGSITYVLSVLVRSQELSEALQRARADYEAMKKERWVIIAFSIIL